MDRWMGLPIFLGFQILDILSSVVSVHLYLVSSLVVSCSCLHDWLLPYCNVHGFSFHFTCKTETEKVEFQNKTKPNPIFYSNDIWSINLRIEVVQYCYHVIGTEFMKAEDCIWPHPNQTGDKFFSIAPIVNMRTILIKLQLYSTS